MSEVVKGLLGSRGWFVRSVWLTSGIWLRTAQTGLHIFNALDENGLSSEPPLTSPELRRYPI